MKKGLIFNLVLMKKRHGGSGYRSRYLSHAKRALYHLSYAPSVDRLCELVERVQALAQGGYTWQGATFPLGQELDMVEQQVIQSSGAPLEALDLTLLTLYHASRVEKHLTRIIF